MKYGFRSSQVKYWNIRKCQYYLFLYSSIHYDFIITNNFLCDQIFMNL